MARKHRRNRKSRALAGLGCNCNQPGGPVGDLGFAAPPMALGIGAIALLAVGGYFAYKKFVK